MIKQGLGQPDPSSLELAGLAERLHAEPVNILRTKGQWVRLSKEEGGRLQWGRGCFTKNQIIPRAKGCPFPKRG